MARSTYLESELDTLVEAGALREFMAQRTDHPKPWVLLARRGARWIPIRSKRENPRTWASLDTLEKFTRAQGIQAFGVESLLVKKEDISHV